MNKDYSDIAIIGCGAWGTALACVLAGAGRRVTLYARSMHLARAVTDAHENLLYLPGFKLHENIRATHVPEEAVAGAQLVLLSTPAQAMRETLKVFTPFLAKGVPLVNTSKGIEIETGKLPSVIAAEEAPDHPYAVLSGPTFAHEVAAGLPAAVTLATTATDGRAWAEALHAKMFRPYLSSDVIGVETSGALKNVIAIACGIVEGRKLGRNARAAVMTRGMAEIRRLGARLGGKDDTFLGLSGLGDLTLTCNAMESRNFSLGTMIGGGMSLTEALKTRKAVTEGVTTARAVARLSKETGVEMPICLAVDHILHGGGNVDEVVTGLLSRAIKSENT